MFFFFGLSSQTAGTNFSIGQFFNEKSDELGDMVSGFTPPTHEGVPLVDMSQLCKSLRKIGIGNIYFFIIFFL
jgi:hypothetical protein